MTTDNEKQEFKQMLKPISDKLGVSDVETDALVEALSDEQPLESFGIKGAKAGEALRHTMTDQPCEAATAFLNSYCEKCFTHGEEAHAAGIARDRAVKWVLKNKITQIFCAACVVAGWNNAEKPESEEL